MLKILGRGTSGNVQKVVWLLEELRQPYTGRTTGVNSTTPRPRTICAQSDGKVPTLVDGEVVVWESNTILRYLCNKLGRRRRALSDGTRGAQPSRALDGLAARLAQRSLPRRLPRGEEEGGGARSRASRPTPRSWSRSSRSSRRARPDAPGSPARIFRSPIFAWGPSSIACLSFPVTLPALTGRPSLARPGRGPRRLPEVQSAEPRLQPEGEMRTRPSSARHHGAGHRGDSGARRHEGRDVRRRSGQAHQGRRRSSRRPPRCCPRSPCPIARSAISPFTTVLPPASRAPSSSSRRCRKISTSRFEVFRDIEAHVGDDLHPRLRHFRNPDHAHPGRHAQCRAASSACIGRTRRTSFP